MQIGWSGAGKAVYFVYSFFCHQLPERSFFLFGQKTMYSLTEIQAAWQDTINPLILRKFIGNADMGWKVAWSDRMISFYTSIWLCGRRFAARSSRFRGGDSSSSFCPSHWMAARTCSVTLLESDKAFATRINGWPC